MSLQQVAGVEVVTVALTRLELMSLLVGVQNEVNRLRRSHGAPPSTLSTIEARLVRVARSMHRDANLSSSTAPVATPGPRPAGGPPSSVVLAHDGPVRSLSTSEAAAQLKVSTRTVQRLFDKGALEGERVDGRGAARITATSVAVEALRRSTGEAPDHGVDIARTPPSDRGADPGRDQGAAAAS